MALNMQDAISQRLREHGQVNVVIAGMSCSGKTTLANRIYEVYSARYPVALIAQDDYYKNLADIPRAPQGYLTDSLHAFHTLEFKRDAKMLLTYGAAFVPTYDMRSNTRLDKSRIVGVGSINVFEGLHTVHLLRELENSLGIYVDTDVGTCLERRIARDTAAYGVSEVRIRQYWEECIKPMAEELILPQKALADIIINGKGGDFL